MKSKLFLNFQSLEYAIEIMASWPRNISWGSCNSDFEERRRLVMLKCRNLARATEPARNISVMLLMKFKESQINGTSFMWVFSLSILSWLPQIFGVENTIIVHFIVMPWWYLPSDFSWVCYALLGSKFCLGGAQGIFSFRCLKYMSSCHNLPWWDWPGLMHLRHGKAVNGLAYYLHGMDW